MVADANNRSGTSDRVTVDEPVPTGAAAIGKRAREVAAFGGYYLSAQFDRIKLTAINIAMFAVLGVMALAIGLAVVFTAAVLLVVGVAQAIGSLLGGHMWAGNLITAVAILGVIAAAVVIGFKVVTKSTRGKVAATYEQRKREQRADFNTDVKQQSR